MQRPPDDEAVLHLLVRAHVSPGLPRGRGAASPLQAAAEEAGGRGDEAEEPRHQRHEGRPGDGGQ